VTLGAWNMNGRKLDTPIDYEREEEAVWSAIARCEPSLRSVVEARYARPLATRAIIFPFVAAIARRLQ
jgi:hypothetical protein